MEKKSLRHMLFLFKDKNVSSERAASKKPGWRRISHAKEGREVVKQRDRPAIAHHKDIVSRLSAMRFFLEFGFGVWKLKFLPPREGSILQLNFHQNEIRQFPIRQFPIFKNIYF